MIKSHRCCPTGTEQVAVHVLLKDARNDPERIRSADLSVFGLPRYHWSTLGHLTKTHNSIIIDAHRGERGRIIHLLRVLKMLLVSDLWEIN